MIRKILNIFNRIDINTLTPFQKFIMYKVFANNIKRVT